MTKNNKSFFVRIDKELLSRTDISSTRKLVIAYLQLRHGLEGWTFNATDIANTLGISYTESRREVKFLEATNFIKCIGYKGDWQKRYKKYVLTEASKMDGPEASKMDAYKNKKKKEVQTEEVQKKEVQLISNSTENLWVDRAHVSTQSTTGSWVDDCEFSFLNTVAEVKDILPVRKQETLGDLGKALYLRQRIGLIEKAMEVEKK